MTTAALETTAREARHAAPPTATAAALLTVMLTAAITMVTATDVIVTGEATALGRHGAHHRHAFTEESRRRSGRRVDQFV